jgi:hypothetical protein
MIHLDQQQINRLLSVLLPIIDQSFEAFSTFHLPAVNGPVTQAFQEGSNHNIICREFV